MKFSKTSGQIFCSIPVFGFAFGLVGSPKAERINESTESRKKNTLKCSNRENALKNMICACKKSDGCLRDQQLVKIAKWVFPKIVVPPNHPF